MAYTKTTWADEVLSGAARYNILENGGGAFKSNMQINLATGVSVAGTGLTAARMNNIELALELLANQGWVTGTGTWSYTSADAPSFVMSVPDADAALMNVGAKITIIQTTQKYFIVTAKGTPSGGNTPVTIYGGTDYTLANAAITSKYWSHAKSPLGFPMNPGKWTVEVTDNQNRTQAAPSQNTWYNINAALRITIPIGCWDVEYSAEIYAYRSTIGQAHVMSTLSTANNTESDNDWHTEVFSSCQVNGVQADTGGPAHKRKGLLLASKTLYYFNVGTNQTNITALYVVGANSKTIFRAICSYL